MRKPRPQGLSTGQSAAYCLVSPATILNWIKAGRLHAQRTVGGQFRIHRADLRRFMRQSGMSTEMLDRDMRPFCWEVYSLPDGSVSEACERCPVRKHAEYECYLFCGQHPDPPSARSCTECGYHRSWSHEPAAQTR